MIEVLAIIAAVIAWEALILWIAIRFMSRESQWKALWAGIFIAAFVLIKEMPWWASAASALPLSLLLWFAAAILRERKKALPIPDAHCKICGGALFRSRNVRLTLHKYDQDARFGQRRRNHKVAVEPGPPNHDWIHGCLVTRT